jgi:histidyl-tRNA synthetase
MVFECKCENPECAHVRDNAPRSIGLLPEHDRHHIMDVLEYLEVASLPYEIRQGLFGPSVYHSQDLFEIVSDPGKKILAKGEKYDQLSRMVGLTKQIPSVVMSIKYDKIPKTEKYKKARKSKDKRPLFYFIQLGYDAKRKSLRVLEILRGANIRLKHNLFKDDMGSQYDAAKDAKAPYIIILGQKEANEDTVIVRNVDTRSQDTVPLDELAVYIKKLK